MEDEWLAQMERLAELSYGTSPWMYFAIGTLIGMVLGFFGYWLGCRCSKK